MQTKIENILDWLNKPIHAAPLTMFRVLFGLLMAFNTVRFWYFGWIQNHFVDPSFHFTYFGFDWIKPLSEAWMYGLHVLAFLAAIGIMLGFFYRLSALLFFLLFTYFELIDLTYYLNHYYFISLVSGLIIFMPLHRYFSLDVRLGRVEETDQLPRWPLLLVQFQIATVYIFAGLAKMNYDWLFQGLPLRIWLPADSGLPIIGWMFKYPETAYLFSWIGMLFDTFIVFFLLNRFTRPAAYVVVVVFHTITGILFQIGVFPLVMSLLVLVFFSESWHQKVLQRLQNVVYSILPAKQSESGSKTIDLPRLKKAGLFLVATYMLFQLTFPWRFIAYPGSMYWTEEAYRFGWRVMLVEKAGTAQFFVRDGEDGREGEVYNREFLNPHQEKQMSFQPDMILQFAHFLEDHYKAQGMKDPIVRCEAWVTLNGRPGQLLFDPQLDLTEVRDSWAPKAWINPQQR